MNKIKEIVKTMFSGVWSQALFYVGVFNVFVVMFDAFTGAYLFCLINLLCAALMFYLSYRDGKRYLT